MTGAALRGLRVVLRKPVAYFAVKAGKPVGVTTHVEIHLECGHEINIKLSRLTHDRYRCPECSDNVRTPSN